MAKKIVTVTDILRYSVDEYVRVPFVFFLMIASFQSVLIPF